MVKNKYIFGIFVILFLVIFFLIFILFNNNKIFNNIKSNNNSIIPQCNSYSVDECPKNCVICPPCIYCSSISCQSEEFCKEIGFDENWYDEVVMK